MTDSNSEDKNPSEKSDFIIPSILLVIVLGLCLIPLYYQDGYTSASTYEIVGSGLSGLGLVGIVTAIIFQRKELAIQRKELTLQRTELALQRQALENTAKEFKIQNNTINIQQFESTFFQMLSLHHETIDKLRIVTVVKTGLRVNKPSIGQTTLSDEEIEIYEKREVFEYLKNTLSYRLRLADKGLNTGIAGWQEFLQRNKRLENFEEAEEQMQNTCQLFFEENHKYIGHYLRNLTQIFRYINLSDFTFSERQFYFDLVKSQFSDSELFVLKYYLLTNDYGFPEITYYNVHFNLIEGLPNENLEYAKNHFKIFIKMSDLAMTKIHYPRNDDQELHDK